MDDEVAYSQLLGPFPYRATTTGKVIPLDLRRRAERAFTSQIVWLEQKSGHLLPSRRNSKSEKCVERFPHVTAL